ncbi:hypothetical protein E8E14_014014 [Neopestalotiopsis sp. 37M]|nr:hypothetical protein E8E14_014014 [Neopestalotiopsis sp. 37M]
MAHRKSTPEVNGLRTPPITPETTPTKTASRAKNRTAGHPSRVTGSPVLKRLAEKHNPTRPPRTGENNSVQERDENPNSSTSSNGYGCRTGDLSHEEMVTEALNDLSDDPNGYERSFASRTSAKDSRTSTIQPAPVVPLTCNIPTESQTSNPRKEIRGRLKQMTPTTIDERLRACLRKPLTKAQSNYTGVGNNYMFEVTTKDPSGCTIVKIGVTRGPEHVRLAGIARDCRHLAMAAQDDPEHMPIRLYQRAEMLAHKELEDWRWPFSCRCKVKNHREYFAVRKEVALEVMQRWREFCRREPYDGQGELRPFWRHRLDRFHFIRGGADGPAYDTPETRSRKWTTFMNPTRYEVMWYDLEQTLSSVWKWRWLAVALVQSFVIAILALPRVYPIFIFAFMVTWVSAETSGIPQPLFLRAIGWSSASIRQTGFRRYKDESTPPDESVYIDPFQGGSDSQAS